jgi:hypothetical protein
MKNTPLILAFLIAIALSITSCSKKSSNPQPVQNNNNGNGNNTFTPFTLKMYCSDGDYSTSNKLMASVYIGTDSINFTNSGGVSNFKRQKTSSCTESSNGITYTFNSSRKYYFKIISTSGSAPYTYNNSVTHFGVLIVASDRTITMRTYSQTGGPGCFMALNHCGVDNYRLTFHYPNTLYND